MKERPIPMSAPMVRAILEGRKTQTRRVAKLTSGGHVRLGHRRWHPDDPEAVLACPYGQPGDRLWVRETWHQHYAGGVLGGRPCYRADEMCTAGDVVIGWRPSTRMPRWASRITLEVTGVRVERVQDITVGGTMLPSGVVREGCPKEYAADCDDPDGRQELKWYRELWDSLNAKRGFPWKLNPYVWATIFKRIH